MTESSTSSASTPIFPPLTRADVLACQFSSWYPTFESITIKATIIKPLSADFREYLEADSVTLPEGSENRPPITELSDEEDNKSEDDTPPPKTYAFPDLDARIRNIITHYGAVFPKLNWTSPQDAAWMLAPSSPLKCTSPADVYLFLKSSDFASHDLDPKLVFDGCVLSEEETQASDLPSYELELVLKRWYAIEKSRELRCFVRDEKLIAISQRDPNHYDFLNESATQESIRTAVSSFWESKIQHMWLGGSHYVFDILLTRDLARAHIIDFNPYAPRTDPLLFTYVELADLFSSDSTLPEFRVITSRQHPRASRTSPQNVHNMIPKEAFELSGGRTINDFQGIWDEEIRKAMEEGSEEEE